MEIGSIARVKKLTKASTTWCILGIPFAAYEDRGRCARTLSAITTTLTPGGLAFVVGPSWIGTILRAYSIRLLDNAGVKELLSLPLLQEHLCLHLGLA